MEAAPPVLPPAVPAPRPPAPLPPPAPRHPPASPGSWRLAAILLLATLFSTTTLGAVWGLVIRTDVATDLVMLLSPGTVRAVWSRPGLLLSGLAFSLPALFILLCHELGHYLACRRYRLPATPPYFLPVPLALGTFGAFIRIRSPLRDKRQLFDVGVAGPLAGFVALLPFLILGVSRSQVAPVETAPLPEASAYLFVPGRCLALVLATRFLHGPLAEGTILVLHPFALAAWIGLLATALNLLPLGQLDGGHILYAVTGRLQRWVALPLWAALAATGVFYWHGWLLWCLVTAVMGVHHPPLADEATPLDRRRRWLAAAAALVFLLAFMPVPLAIVNVR